MAEHSGNEDELGLDNVFEEPPRPPTPPPTLTTYHRQATRLKSDASEWSTLDLQLVGHHVLWAQHLWNAAIILADFLDLNSLELCRDKAVLELGAGGALPSLVAALCGAHQVVITDYPDAPLLDNITRNIDHNIPSHIHPNVKAQGYVWGTNPEKLFQCLDRTNSAGDSLVDARTVEKNAFDVIILSDLIFNHSQHSALLDTCESALRPARRLEEVAQDEMKSADPKKLSHEPERAMDISTPCVLVFFSHHRPQYISRDLDFFTRAKERGWICEQVVQTKMKAMFPNDPGDEEVRSTVHGWILRRSGAIALKLLAFLELLIIHERFRSFFDAQTRSPTLLQKLDPVWIEDGQTPLNLQSGYVGIFDSILSYQNSLLLKPTLPNNETPWSLSFTPPFAPCKPSVTLKFALKFVVYSPTIAETSLLVMRPSFIVTALFALASTAVATFDKACPPLYGLKPLNEGCTAVVKKGILGIPYCESTCTSHPQPSGHYGKAKRNQPILGPDGTLQRCPSAMTACPIDPPPALNGDRATATISPNEPYECVKPSEDLYNCGGCSSTGLGISCVDLPGVRGTSCTEGKCTICKFFNYMRARLVPDDLI
ncbi:Protein N-terminal and lysine N-methyltransferase EFM7, partial [Rhizoctonia solani]